MQLASRPTSTAFMLPTLTAVTNVNVSTMLLNRVSIDETVETTWCSRLPGPELTMRVQSVSVFMTVLTIVDVIDMSTDALNVVTAPVLKSPPKPVMAKSLLVDRKVFMTMTTAGVSRKYVAQVKNGTDMVTALSLCSRVVNETVEEFVCPVRVFEASIVATLAVDGSALAASELRGDVGGTSAGAVYWTVADGDGVSEGGSADGVASSYGAE